MSKKHVNKSVIAIAVLVGVTSNNAFSADCQSGSSITVTCQITAGNSTVDNITVNAASGDGIDINQGTAASTSTTTISNSIISAPSNKNAIVYYGDGGVLNLENVTVTNTPYQALNINGGSNEVNVMDSSLSSYDQTIILNGNVTDTTLNIDNSSLTTSNSDAIVVSNNSSNTVVNVSNTQVTSHKEGMNVKSKNGTININDSTFSAANFSAIEIVDTGDMSALTIDGSAATGEQNGISVTANNFNFSLDGSTITGTSGNGIAIIDNGTSSNADVENSSVSGEVTGLSITGNNALLNISGSTVSGSTGDGIDFFDGGDSSTLNISNSRISGAADALNLSGNNILATIDGSEITNEDSAGSAINIGVSDNSTVNINKSVINGAITQDAGSGSNSISMSDSTLNGNIDDISGTLSVSMNSGSVWNVSSDSSLSDLSIDHSTVNLNSGNVSTSTLEGNNALITTTYNANTQAYNVLSAGTATGSYTVGFSSTGQAANPNLDGALIVTTGGGDATFSSQTSDIGAWQYNAVETANAAGGTDVTMEKGGLSTSANAALNARSAAVNVWNMENSSLEDRMNAGRRNLADQGGVWASYYGGDNHATAGDAAEGYDQNTNGVMLGFDTTLDGNDGGNWLAGVAFSRGNSDVSETGASSNIDNYAGQVYLSRRYENGFFWDTTAKFEHFTTSQDVTSTDGARSHSNYTTNGYGGTLKGGYTWTKGNVFVEPYAKASMMTLSGVDYVTSNGMQVNDSRYDSLRGEAGADIGMNLTLGRSATEVKPYIHLAAIDETSNGNSMNINGENFDDSIDGTAIQTGAGVQVQVTKTFGGYATMNYTKGNNDIENPWQSTVGLIYTW